MYDFMKYPRTPHLVGSGIQDGDEDIPAVPFDQALKGKFVVIEEKVDGANSGISFPEPEHMTLQSRGHELTGGPREIQFALMKAWAAARKSTFWEVLGTRYLMFGEWCYNKHSQFYDLLPHYFLEFDIWDREQNVWLSTEARNRVLDCTGVVHVPVLWQGVIESLDQVTSLIGPSLYKSPEWERHLIESAADVGVSAEKVRKETDMTTTAEGVYIKVEDGDRTVDRYKFVRGDFVQLILDSGSHHMDRPILPNRLAPGVNIWE